MGAATLEGVELGGLVVALWVIAAALAAAILVRALLHPLTSLPVVGGSIAGLADGAVHYLQDAMHATLRGIERVLSEFLDSIAVLVGVPLAVGVLAWDLLAGHIQHLVQVKVPALIHSVTNAIANAVEVLKHRTTVVERTVVHEVSRAGAAERALERLVTTEAINPLRHYLDVTWRNFQTRYEQLVTFTTVTLPNRIAVLGGRVGTIEHELWGSIRSRLGRLEALTTEAAIGAVAIAAVSRALPWIRCNNVGRTAERLCGLDTDLLDALLTGALGALVLADIDELIRLAQGTAGAIEGELRDMIGV